MSGIAKPLFRRFIFFEFFPHPQLAQRFTYVEPTTVKFEASSSEDIFLFSKSEKEEEKKQKQKKKITFPAAPL